MLLDFRPRGPRRFRALKILEHEHRITKAGEQRRVLFHRRLRAAQPMHHNDRRMRPSAVRQKLLDGNLLVAAGKRRHLKIRLKMPQGRFAGKKTKTIPPSPTWPDCAAGPRRSRAAPRCGKPATAAGRSPEWATAAPAPAEPGSRGPWTRR